jgi:hypothetical protein
MQGVAAKNDAPMVAKSILPRLGCTPMVWNTRLDAPVALRARAVR